MSFELCYPNWRSRALTFSYDDGQIHDRRLVELFNKYGLKATFHLNSGKLDQEGFVTRAELPTLYEGHEIACHGVDHAYPTHLPQSALVQEFWNDRLALEEASGRIIRGCSYAFGEYDDNVVNTLKTLGFAYCRGTNSHHQFYLPKDFMEWTPTCHHDQAFDTMEERFLHQPRYRKLSLCYIWGHSYEFPRDDTWEKMEKLCAAMSGHEDEIWYATNIEIVDYLNAARALVFSADGTRAENHSNIKIYGILNGEKVAL